MGAQSEHESTGKTKEAVCIACGDGLKPFGKRLDYYYYVCLGCGTIQLAPMPSQEELERSYQEEYSVAGHIDHDPELNRRVTRPLHRALLRAFRDNTGEAPVLDYGAGWGGLTHLLCEKRIECRGYDISNEMVGYCQAEGLPVEKAAIAAIEDVGWGALILSVVFEHLVDPETWLVEANRLLKPGGLLISLQPTALFARWAGTVTRLGFKALPLPAIHSLFCPPWHTAFYSIDGMKCLVERHGFQWVDTRPAPQHREPGLNGVLQRMLEAVNRVGWAFAGTRWPLVPGHIFVFRKTQEPGVAGQ